MHIHINTTDIRWAISFAGAFKSAREGNLAKANPKFTVSFEKTTPEITEIANCFGVKPQNCEDYVIPEESDYPFFDRMSAILHQKELEEQHGILQPPHISPLNYSALASNCLLYTHDIVSKPGFFYPELSKKYVTEYNGVAQNESYVEQLTAFINGYSNSDPKIFVIGKDGDHIEAIKILNSASCEAYCGAIDDPMMFVLRAYYKGYDFISEALPVLSMTDNLDLDQRGVCSWGSCIPVFGGETLETLTLKGSNYKTRKKHKFDYFNYLKSKANG